MPRRHRQMACHVLGRFLDWTRISYSLYHSFSRQAPSLPWSSEPSTRKWLPQSGRWRTSQKGRSRPLSCGVLAEGCSSCDPSQLTWEGDRKGQGVEWDGWFAQASFRFCGQRPRGRTVTEDSTKAVRKCRSTETIAMPFPPTPLGAAARSH